MTLPISRSALDKLGKRLCASEVAEAEWDLLERVLDEYQAALDEVQAILEDLGFAPTSRVKSTSTLIEKLRRGTSFKSVSDVAGARIVVHGGRPAQDEAVRKIEAAFVSSDPTRPPRVKDRRVDPSHGYRAVHVVVHRSGLPVEIQVRTTLQDVWAQIVERLGDVWGRELRYGESLRRADEPIFPGANLDRNGFVANLKSASQMIDLVEQFQAESGSAATLVVAREDPEQEPGKVSLKELEESLAEWLGNLSAIVGSMEGER